MRKLVKNRKGFTLAEEVVTVLLIGILVASASGILLNAMRIFLPECHPCSMPSPRESRSWNSWKVIWRMPRPSDSRKQKTIAADDGCAIRSYCMWTHKTERAN